MPGYHAIPSSEFHLAIHEASDRIRDVLSDRECLITTGLDDENPKLPLCLTTVGLSRFGMAEICMVYQSIGALFQPEQFSQLITWYQNLCRWDHTQHTGIWSDIMIQWSGEAWAKTPFSRHRVKANYIDRDQFLHGYGFTIRPVIQEWNPKIIQLVVSDHAGRWPDNKAYVGTQQVILP